jgi:hypothetical protein
MPLLAHGNLVTRQKCQVTDRHTPLLARDDVMPRQHHRVADRHTPLLARAGWPPRVAYWQVQFWFSAISVQRSAHDPGSAQLPHASRLVLVQSGSNAPHPQSQPSPPA